MNQNIKNPIPSSRLSFQPRHWHQTLLQSQTLRTMITTFSLTTYAFLWRKALLISESASEIGINFWPYREFSIYHVFIVLTHIQQRRGNDPFANHVAMIEDFLHKFSNKEKSKSLTENFSKYIVACCWEKMHRQITHWFPWVAIQSFFLVNRDCLLDHFRTCEFIPSTWQDSMLGHFLKEKEKDVLDILN